jgi:hypothetical protein
LPLDLSPERAIVQPTAASFLRGTARKPEFHALQVIEVRDI